MSRSNSEQINLSVSQSGLRLFQLIVILSLCDICSPNRSISFHGRVSSSSESDTGRYLQTDIVFRPPNFVSQDARFGETIAASSVGQKNYIMIGAPHNNGRNGSVLLCNYLNDITRGAVYDCNKEIRPSGDNLANSNGTKGMLLGASIASIPKTENDLIGIICAPLYHKKNEFQGMCNLLTITSNDRNISKFISRGTKSSLFGFSAKITPSVKDANCFSTLIGAPGSESGQGFVSLSDTCRTGNLLELRSERQSEMDWADPGLYRGYAVEFGKDNKMYVSTLHQETPSGPPVGVLAAYQVIAKVFTSSKIQSVPNSQGFGMNIVRVQVSGKTDDILVGEPFYTDLSEDKTDVGRVHVFCRKFEQHTVIIGPESSGRFGTSIVNINDINDDKMDDFVVGCPYCDNGRGIVFLFLGKDNCRYDAPDQVIRASTMGGEPLNGFGMSLSNAVDLDRNGKDDFLVGAPKSNAAVLVLSRPLLLSSIFLKTRDCSDGNSVYITNNEPAKLNLCKQITVFLTLNQNNKDFYDVINSISKRTGFKKRFRVTVIMDSHRNSMKRLKYNGAYNYTLEKEIDQDLASYLSINMGSLSNTNFSIVHENMKKDLSTPLAFTANVEMIYPSNANRSKGFGLVPRITTEWKPYRIEIMAPDFCKENCSQYLKVRFPIYRERSINYASRNVTATALVFKELDENFATGKLRVTTRNGLEIIKLLVTGDTLQCEYNDESSVNCDIAKYLTNPEFQVTIHMYFKTEKLNTKGKPILSIEVLNDNEKNLNATDKAFIEFEVIYNPIVVFEPGPKSQQTIIDERNKTYSIYEREITQELRIGPRMSQTYRLINNGSSIFRTTKINITVPVLSELGDRLIYLSSKVRVDGKVVSGGPKVISTSNRSKGHCIIPKTFDNPMDLAIIKSRSTYRRRRIRRSVQEEESSQGSSIFKTKNRKVRIACGNYSSEFGYPKCIVIQCVVDQIGVNDYVDVTLEGWLWAQTMQKKYISDIQILTTAKGQLDIPIGVSIVKNLSSLSTNYVSISTEFVFPRVTLPTRSQLPIWIIIVAIILGILVLCLIILCLRKLGFFKRQRRPFATHNTKFMEYGGSETDVHDRMLHVPDSDDDLGNIHSEDDDFMKYPPSVTVDTPVFGHQDTMIPSSVDTGISGEVNSSSSSPAQALGHRDNDFESPSLGMSDEASI